MGIGRDQSATCLRLLELAYLVIQLPAWSTNLSARVAKRPKLHLVDAFHFRTNDGVEVDLVLEAADGQVCAI
jgi:predicted AAA+ superfamily ATPase